ncbi:MAG TPA: cation-transporting P-type ATPase [Chloroflexia bacterium]|nr:cation-transporting P-type ATPase [Chloroflexia bacterium]
MEIKQVPWHSLSPEATVNRLGVNPSTGLSEAQAEERLAQFGLNRLLPEKKEPIWEEIIEELTEPMILLLLGTGILYSIWGEISDALTIFFIIFALIASEVYNEARAKRAIEALGKLAEPTIQTLRAGRYIELPVEQVVPGDIVLVQTGQRIPADARLLESYNLSLEEAALTGESVPVDKSAEALLPGNTPLAEQANIVLAGTVVAHGRGRAVVVATGKVTELGKVAGLAGSVKPPRTPLQLAMRELTRWMVWIALGFSLLVPLLGWLVAGQSFQQMLLTGLSLAFATIPEEMPILITMVLALGAYRLSKQHAIVKRLRAVEALGAVTTIATDKTGTLTQNRMEVSRIYPEEAANRVLEIGALCNEALQNGNSFSGDPVDIALLKAAQQAGLDPEILRQTYLLDNEFSFDNLRKLMSAVYRREGKLWIAVKGAPEAILARSTAHITSQGCQPLTQDYKNSLLAEIETMATQGLRVIGFAEAMHPASEHLLTQEEAESGLCFVGLAGFADPIRSEVYPAMRACRTAGIRPLIITGDHPRTARTIAKELDFNDDLKVITGPELDRLSDSELAQVVQEVAVYARTTPTHKLRIVQALISQGERVAVTGDGINDAPALAAADIGVAMGEGGTDTAREAADIVLADDNFATIVRALGEGRVLFANLKKAVRYYLACKVALISITLLPALLGLPVPFAPVQIILLELFMDLAASATFIAEKPEEDLMLQPPRNLRARFMDKALISSIFMSAAGLFAAVSIAYLLTWYSGAGLTRAQTMAFVTWMLGHMLLALNMRSEREPLFKLGFFSNRLMLAWGGSVVIFLLAVSLIPGVQTLLRVSSLSGNQWLLALALALAGSFWLEIVKWLSYRSTTGKVS